MALPLLDALPEEDRREVMRLARRRRFARNEVVFHEGDPGDTLHLIVHGHVAVRTTTPLGDVAMLRILGAGQIFGELALLAPGPRIATIAALESCETLSLRSDLLHDLRRTYPAVDRLFLDALVGEVRRLSAHVLELMYVAVDKRLHRRLVELARLYGGEVPVTIALTQQDLAELTGTTRPTANRVLRAAEVAGLVRVGRGRIEILEIEKLERLGR